MWLPNKKYLVRTFIFDYFSRFRWCVFLKRLILIYWFARKETMPSHFLSFSRNDNGGEFLAFQFHYVKHFFKSKNLIRIIATSDRLMSHQSNPIVHFMRLNSIESTSFFLGVKNCNLSNALCRVFEVFVELNKGQKRKLYVDIFSDYSSVISKGGLFRACALGVCACEI